MVCLADAIHTDTVVGFAGVQQWACNSADTNCSPGDGYGGCLANSACHRDTGGCVQAASFPDACAAADQHPNTAAYSC